MHIITGLTRQHELDHMYKTGKQMILSALKYVDYTVFGNRLCVAEV